LNVKVPVVTVNKGTEPEPLHAIDATGLISVVEHNSI
jgi:hypothetical protein